MIDEATPLGDAETDTAAPAAPAEVRPIEDWARKAGVSDFDLAGLRYATFGNAVNAACTEVAFNKALADFRATPCCAFRASGREVIR